MYYIASPRSKSTQQIHAANPRSKSTQQTYTQIYTQLYTANMNLKPCFVIKNPWFGTFSIFKEKSGAGN